MQNFVSLALNLTLEEGEAASQWLGAQPDNVQRVSSIGADGRIYQRPVVSDTAYVDPTARLIGGMIVGEECYVGPYAVIRLDEKSDPTPLVIGQGTNIQDGAIVHSTTHDIGKRVIVAHQAIVHGARICDNVTLYIQAVADGNGTVIEEGAFLHQGSYVGKGIRIPANRLVAPGQKVLTQEEADALPTVPDPLRGIQEHVLELNASHNHRYRSDAQ